MSTLYSLWLGEIENGQENADRDRKKRQIKMIWPELHDKITIITEAKDELDAQRRTTNSYVDTP